MAKKLFSFLFFIVYLSFLSAEIPQSEKQALYAIASSIQTPFNWNDQTPVGQWRGVTVSNVDGGDHVTGLNIDFNKNGQNLVFNFSGQVSNLTYLQDLGIRYNIYSNGNVFNFDFQNLVGLTRLKNLNLERSGIRTPGSNWSDDLKNLDQLAQIANLEKLSLNINSSKIKIPNIISSVFQLKELYYCNYLDDTVNISVFQNTSLESITLLTSTTSVDGAPNSFSHLVNLKSLKIGGSFFQLPSSFYTIPNLEELSIVSDSYCFPAEIGNYSNTLKKLSLEKSYCVYLPPLQPLSNLEVLHLISPYGFSVDDSILQLGKLRELYLESDSQIQITGNISQMSSLENLFYYSWNSPIDEKIYSIHNLKQLVLGTPNNVSENVGNLQKLEHLQVQFKDSFNMLPKLIGNIVTLKKVDFLDYGSTHPELVLPSEYFTKWGNLEQFWAAASVSGDVTNRFLNKPNLKAIVFNNTKLKNLTGKLNLCQNPNLDYIRLEFSSVGEVDLRNVSSIANGTSRLISFWGNTISKFIVDDMTQFNNLVSQGKITISANTPSNYIVTTSVEPCERILAQQDVKIEKSQVFPNPVKNVLTIKTDNKVENVQIISATGQKKNINFFNNKANLSALPSGLYIIQWSEKGVNKIEKIIKQ